MNKFFKIVSKIVLLVLIIYFLCSILITIISWGCKPKNQIIDNPILLSEKVIILGSEKELPLTSSLMNEKKDQVYITFMGDILKVWYFNQKISENFLCQEIEVVPVERLSRQKSFPLLFISPMDCFIKSVSFKTKGNLLEIQLGVSTGRDIAVIILTIMIILLALSLLIYKDKQKKK